MLSNSINEGEKKYLENKISAPEMQKGATDRQVEELNAQVAELKV